MRRSDEDRGEKSRVPAVRRFGSPHVISARFLRMSFTPFTRRSRSGGRKWTGVNGMLTSGENREPKRAAGRVVKVLSSEGSVSLLVRSRRISPLSLVTSPHHFGSVPWDERGERRQKEDRTEWDETERGRSRHSSSVVGLVHYVHHPTPSSERSDRRPAAGESGVKKDGEGDEPNVTKKRAGIDHSRRHTGPFTSVSAHPRLPLLTTFPPVTKDDWNLHERSLSWGKVESSQGERYGNGMSRGWQTMRQTRLSGKTWSDRSWVVRILGRYSPLVAHSFAPSSFTSFIVCSSRYTRLSSSSLPSRFGTSGIGLSVFALSPPYLSEP